ncbi:MAG: hypothetical protein Fur002_11100 [Anaerolineales bacterium]
MKISSANRLLLLGAGLLAAYQIAIGIDRMDAEPIAAYTIAFGALLVSALLLIILGFDALEAPAVVVISTVIPLTLSLGLIWQYAAAWRSAYLAFAVIAFLAVIISRAAPLKNELRVALIALAHGVSGMVIFLLPILAAAQAKANPLFALTGAGGAFIGIAGLLLSFLKMGKPILSKETALRIFPVIFFFATLFFVIGFKYR